jgi:hypothetical protein
MDPNSIIISSTASYRALNADQRSSTEIVSNYDISGVLIDVADLPSLIMPHKQYRVVAGQLYVVRPGSPPTPQS